MVPAKNTAGASRRDRNASDTRGEHGPPAHKPRWPCPDDGKTQTAPDDTVHRPGSLPADATGRLHAGRDCRAPRSATIADDGGARPAWPPRWLARGPPWHAKSRPEIQF